MKSCVHPDVFIKTDQRTGYSPLKETFEKLVQVKSGSKGNNFPETHRIIMGMKGCPRGIHHHVEILQTYLDEYSYRLNRSFMKNGIFDNLLTCMVECQPCPYKIIRD